MSAHRPSVVTPDVLRDWALPRPGEGKDARGRVLVVGGGEGTPGAVRLAGEASLRAGAGKLALATVASCSDALAVAVPESQVLSLPATRDGEIAEEAAEIVLCRAEECDAVLLGPGLGDPGSAVSLLEALVPRLRVPLVIDAVASAFVTEHPDGLHHLEGHGVLTLNPGELAHTSGRSEEEVAEDPAAVAAELASRARVVVLAGGSVKIVAGPDGSVWRIEGGGPGLGVSGSGDVSAGLVTGLLARGAEPAQAAVWAGYLHARAGERLAATTGAVGYLARDLPAQVPQVLSELREA